MTSLIAVLLGIPLSIELIGAALSIRDNWSNHERRAAAMERFALPLLAWGALWWLLGTAAWHTLAWIIALVLAWPVAAFYVTRWLSRWSALQTEAVDRDDPTIGGP
jgi:cobalamin biosynthesis protein CobD/CbiB